MTQPRRASVDVWPIEDGGLAVRLPGHEHEPRPGLRFLHFQHTTRRKNRNLRAPRPASVCTEAGLAFQYIHEAIEVGRNRAAERSALRHLDVQDEPRSPEF